MLDFVAIEKIAAKAAKAKVPGIAIDRVLIEPAVDSDGHDALRIILVLRPDALKALTGDNTLDLLVAVQRELSAKNEERLPIVEYATEAELSEEDGSDELTDDEK